jgi:hypothetical protein
VDGDVTDPALHACNLNGRARDDDRAAAWDMLARMLSEPGPSLTDLALGLVALVLAVRAGPVVTRSWRAMLWWAAAAALAGAVHHGVVTRWPRWAGPSWALISAMVVVTISYALAATVRDVLGPGRRRVFVALRASSLAVYAALAAFGYYGITTILACEGVTMTSVLVLWIVALHRRQAGSGWMVVALAASVVAGCSRALPARMTGTVGLDPTSLYHVAQIPAIVLLYAALVRRSTAGPAGSTPRLWGGETADRPGSLPRPS